MGSRQKQQARATTPKAAPPKGSVVKGKGRAADPPETPVSPARVRRAGASQDSNAAQDAREEAQMMATATDDDKTPPPSSPPQSRGGGGPTERQKKQAEEQKP